MPDTTIYIRNVSDLNQILGFQQAVVYHHISGGVANQLYSFLSSVLLAEMLHLPLICGLDRPSLKRVDFDNSLEKHLFVTRSDNSPVFSVNETRTLSLAPSPAVFPSLRKSRMEAESCWMRDIYGDMRHVMSYRHAAARLATHAFADYQNRTRWVLLDGNCLFYYHWLNNPRNVAALVSRGFLASLQGHFRHRDRLVVELTQRLLASRLRFRAHIQDWVACVLAPFRAKLVPAKTPRRSPPFARFANLVAVHARFGSGLADFADSREFLPPARLAAFVGCLEGIPADSLVFVASDAVAAKLALRQALGERVFALPVLAGHSGATQPTQAQRDASTVWLLIDMIVGSMASLLVGTEGSTFTTMMGMMGGAEYRSVSRFATTCQKSPLYFP